MENPVQARPANSLSTLFTAAAITATCISFAAVISPASAAAEERRNSNRG